MKRYPMSGELLEAPGEREILYIYPVCIIRAAIDTSTTDVGLWVRPRAQVGPMDGLCNYMHARRFVQDWSFFRPARPDTLFCPFEIVLPF
jgi:hypothetical protein